MARYGDEEGKVYVGGLPSDATAEELDEAFGRYGRLRKVWVARRPPGFAFIQFDDIRDAEDAVRALDGSKICGVRARVELSHGRGRGGGRGYRDDRGGRDYYGGYRADDRDRGYDRRGRDYSRSPRRSRSRSRSPKRRRSRSPSYEPQKDGRGRSRSGERSRSRSRSPSR